MFLFALQLLQVAITVYLIVGLNRAERQVEDEKPMHDILSEAENDETELNT